MDKLKVAIIGAGTIGHCHAAAYRKLADVELVAVCDTNRDRAERFARQYDIPLVFDRHEALLQQAAPDAVSVCVWNSLHAPVSIDALNAGAHVLCEKPLALDAEQALDMQRTAERRDRTLMPGFCTRFEDGVRLLKTYVDEQRLGSLYYIKATYLRRRGNPGGWFSDRSRSGGGPIIDLGVHVLDLARFIGGGRAISVYAVSHKMPDNPAGSYAPHMSADAGGLHDVEDFASALIRLDNGIAIQFETSWNHHIESDVFQLEAYGTKGGASVYPKLRIATDDLGALSNVQPIHSNHEDNPNYDFDMEIAHFIRVVRGSETPLCTAEDGVENMRVTDAIYRSAQERREIVIDRPRANDETKEVMAK